MVGPQPTSNRVSPVSPSGAESGEDHPGEDGDRALGQKHPAALSGCASRNPETQSQLPWTHSAALGRAPQCLGLSGSSPAQRQLLQPPQSPQPCPWAGAMPASGAEALAPYQPLPNLDLTVIPETVEQLQLAVLCVHR